MSIPTSLNPMGVATNPEPIDYNMQLSVDKDYIHNQSDNTYNIYKDSPEILYRTAVTGYPRAWRRYAIDPLDFGIMYDNIYDVTRFFIDCRAMFDMCKGEYPLPNTITIEHNGINFTFTPIPVYE